jgi:hypothetical protein
LSAYRSTILFSKDLHSQITPSPDRMIWNGAYFEFPGHENNDVGSHFFLARARCISL